MSESAFAKVMQCAAWQELPANGKFLHILAMQAGLDVSFNGRLWVWRGSPAQMQASGLFLPSANWNFIRRGWMCTSEGLRASLRREGADTIIASHEDFHPMKTSRARARVAQLATACESFQSFKAAMLRPVPIDAT